MMNSLDVEEMVTCPYNKAHVMVLHRMQFHLSKCRAQHPNAETIRCPFNTTHIINKIELELHLRWCKDTITGEREFIKIGHADTPKPVVPVFEPGSIQVAHTEVWGEEDATIPGGSILDQVKVQAKSKMAFTNKICSSKAVKKEHRLNERRRFIEVQDMPKKEESSSKPIRGSGGESAARVMTRPVEQMPPPPAAQQPQAPSQPLVSPQPFQSPQPVSEERDGGEEVNGTASGGGTARKVWGGWNKAPADESLSQSLAQIQLTESLRQREEAAHAAEAPPQASKAQLSGSSGSAWGQQTSGGSAGVWGGWGAANAQSSDVQSVTIPTQMPRDKSNPWKTKPSGGGGYAGGGQGGPADALNDFPGLPVAGRGRGRRLANNH